MICALLANVNKGAKDQKVYVPSDFMPSFGLTDEDVRARQRPLEEKRTRAMVTMAQLTTRAMAALKKQGKAPKSRRRSRREP